MAIFFTDFWHIQELSKQYKCFEFGENLLEQEERNFTVFDGSFTQEGYFGYNDMNLD